MNPAGLFAALFDTGAAPRAPQPPVWVGYKRSARGGVAVSVTQRPAHFRGLSRKAFRLITKADRRAAIDENQRGAR
jgi:hypothetical protein